MNHIQSRTVVLPQRNIDTDQIIPARFLKVTDKAGLGEKLFWDWRYLPNGKPNPEFILNQAFAANARILVAGDNFGCGSSREHAPWALVDFGFQAVISTSIADIFRNNALKNGLLPIAVTPEIHEQLLKEAGLHLEIRLDEQILLFPSGQRVSFELDKFSRHCLMNGVDELGFLLGCKPHISAFEARRA
ncbi:MAG: 3-isopropylmalate dehydratase small subunit [Proteobacteria bacterium]|nr:3-isopropylmalate dehydratase small subunit [Cystobacterineae bacterium]MCL2258480.1 3-isopropylmalate dehydratase small subunit [Cystobacterineae bacterium]MCL2315180.1 3-isopropylmalate dehydratase small subunit [Pseudomonadota bacterium]